MKTLTAQKAREIRDAIINNSAVIEPTIRDHYVAQAMEMAMVVLDAQRDADLFGRGYVGCVHGENPRRIDPKTVNLIYVEG